MRPGDGARGAGATGGTGGDGSDGDRLTGHGLGTGGQGPTGVRTPGRWAAGPTAPRTTGAGRCAGAGPAGADGATGATGRNGSRAGGGTVAYGTSNWAQTVRSSRRLFDTTGVLRPFPEGGRRACRARRAAGPPDRPVRRAQFRLVSGTPDQRHPPSVERLLALVREMLPSGHAPDAVTAAARIVVAAERAALDAGAPPTGLDVLADRVVATVRPRSSGPDAVINATGVIIHTNLGRAPWPRAAIEAAERAAATPLFLELDRDTGRRGRRYRAAEELLITLTGAEDALVTNNNAAALALAVGLAGRSGVAVSRGELVEIGGGVRIPEIIRRAGARLIEVGTTNRTRATDYEAPLAERRARMVLRVHPSNFVISGFTEAPDPVAVATLAHAHGALVVDDLGSGALLDTEAFGLAHEPMPRERLAAGADLVTFSGDKLLGGPQAGLIVGRADLIARLRRDPLARAVRPDKVTLAALAATLDLYRTGLATTEIPIWRMIAATADGLRARAKRLVSAVSGPTGRSIDLVPLEATVGGGSLPGETLPSFGIAIGGRGLERLLARLRTGEPAVIGRIADGFVLLDLRTVDPRDDAGLGLAIRAAIAGP